MTQPTRRNRLFLPLRAQCLGAEVLEDRRMLALTLTDLTTGLTPLDLVQQLIGPGVEVTDVQFTGSNRAAGRFSGGISSGLNLQDGIVLSSGAIKDAVGPNLSEQTTSAFGLPGDPDLDSLIPGYETHDASILEFDFIASAGSISVQYVFGSEEYNEYVGFNYNDVFGFFLDGENIALIPGTTTPVSINNVNSVSNSSLFRNNSPTDLGVPTPYDNQADGFTVVLAATALITPGAHHIKLAVADAGDGILDSWVFLGSESFVSGESDMQITGSTSPDPAIVDNELTYTWVATNNGPDAATRVRVDDILPPGVTFVSASSSQGYVIYQDGVVSGFLGNIAPGGSETMTIVVTANTLGTLTNTATVTAAQIENAPENNSFTLTTFVEPPQLRIDDAQVLEGNEGTNDANIVVAIDSHVFKNTITVVYSTLNNTASGGTDFLPSFGTLTFAPGQSTQIIHVPIVGDKYNESPESFLIQLSNATNAKIVKGTGTVTILDNDPVPNLYVDDVQVTTTMAGDRVAVFSVALDWPSGREVTVGYHTTDGQALAGVDYQGLSDTLTFAPGEQTKQIVVPITTSGVYSGNKKFYFNLSGATFASLADPQGVCTIVYAGEPTGERTIDNGAAGYSRSNSGWETLTNTQAHQLDYDYHAAGDGSAAATWSFSALPTGTYQVLAKWIPFSNRATNAPFTILDGDTSLGTVRVNQQLAPTGDQSNGIVWQSLGTFQVSGNTLNVRLSDNANGYVIADAIRLVRGGIAPQVPEIDVSSYEQSIDNGDTTPSLEDATDFGTTALYTDSLIHTFTIRNNANAELLLTGTPRVSITGAGAADFQILSQPAASVAAGKSTTFQVLFHPTTSGVRSAVVSIANNDGSEHPYTFAIRGTTASESPGSQIVDDSMPAFSKQGTWTALDNSQAYGGAMQRSTSGATARWNFAGLTSGTYFVYASWAPSENLATNAPFSVSNGIDGYSLQVNQQLAPGMYLGGRYWGSLGAIDVVAGMLTVDLAHAPGGSVAADAVMIVRLGSEPIAEPLIHNATLPADVSGDGRVSTADVMIVINTLLREREAAPLAATMTTTVNTQNYYPDVNNDSRISSVDMMMVINYLLRQKSAAPLAAPAAAVNDPAMQAQAVDNALVLFDDTGKNTGNESQSSTPPQVSLAATEVSQPTAKSIDLAWQTFAASLAESESEDNANSFELDDLNLDQSELNDLLIVR